MKKQAGKENDYKQLSPAAALLTTRKQMTGSDTGSSGLHIYCLIQPQLFPNYSFFR